MGIFNFSVSPNWTRCSSGSRDSFGGAEKNVHFHSPIADRVQDVWLTFHIKHRFAAFSSERIDNLAGDLCITIGLPRLDEGERWFRFFDFRNDTIAPAGTQFHAIA